MAKKAGKGEWNLSVQSNSYFPHSVNCGIIVVRRSKACSRKNVVIQLDTKTVYSFMDSLVPIKKYVQKAKDLGQSSGHDGCGQSLWSLSFLRGSRICGTAATFRLGAESDQGRQELHLRLLALDSQGYRNLMKVSTLKMMGQKNWEVSSIFKGLAVIVPAFDGVADLDLGLDFYVGVFPATPQQEFGRPTLPLHTVRYFDRGIWRPCRCSGYSRKCQPAGDWQPSQS